jgi:hypothetical protein
MRRFHRKRGPTVCRTCGIKLSESAQFRQWAQCSVCYWKDRAERSQPLEDLRNRLSEVRARLDVLPREIASLEQITTEYHAKLRNQTPWWRKLAGSWVDETLRSHWNRRFVLDDELRKLKDETRNLESAIQNNKTAKKRSLEAQLARNVAEARKRTETEKHDKFCAASIENLRGEFDRKYFFVQPKDYRRGNSIDNYFRKIEEKVLGAFSHCCVFCNTSHDLTFDHYALSKNEGGNFALITADKVSIRLNIVVLCRGCNAAKSQCDYLTFFNDAQRERAASYQNVLLNILLTDKLFLGLVKKWCR